jgi:hypothetical protein
MSEYRIVPCDDDGWKVQGKWLGLFWRDVGSWVGYQMWSPYFFKTEADAEAHIWSMISDETKRVSRKLTALRRKRTIPPRAFP